MLGDYEQFKKEYLRMADIDLSSYNTFLKNIKISNGNKKKLSTLINQ